jgi:hypothetical protein
MNPLQLLKTAYETFGTPHPKLSLIIVMTIFAVVGGAIWRVGATLTDKENARTATPSSALPQPSTPQNVTGPAATSGNNSPAVTSSGNVFNYGNSQPSRPSKE